jgi:hypothetical protein
MNKGKVIFLGIYSLCTLPSGKPCVKAVFPLPKGNATVIMSPTVGQNGELILDSTGKKFADPGFYFLLSNWTHCTIERRWYFSYRHTKIMGPTCTHIQVSYITKK